MLEYEPYKRGGGEIMYSEDYEEKDKKGFPLKDFLLKLILIIIFVLLLMWLIPWPNNSVLTDRIFNDNIQEMKNASLLYFTKDRLPANVGDKKTITLREMLDLKLLLPFTDKNGKACDVEKSYVTIEKLEDEYLLKVNLKCGEEEDYILVHVGCYAYCTTDVCEKKNNDNTKKPDADNNTNTPKPTGSPQPTNNPKPTTSPTPTSKPDVPEDPKTSQPSCSLIVTDGVLDSNDNKYITDVTISFASKGSTNGATITGYGLGTSLNYKNDNTYKVTKNGSSTIYGYVKDSNGKVASCNVTVVKKDKPVTPDTSYEYQYKKDISRQYTAWTAWSPDTIYVDADNIRFGNYELIEVQPSKTQMEVVGYRPVKITYHKRKPVQVGSYNQVLCTEFTYVRTENVTYQVGGWTATNTYYDGSVAPADSNSERWVGVGVDRTTCEPTCTAHTIMHFRKYVRSEEAVTDNSSTQATCTSRKEIPVPIYAMQDTYETLETKLDVYREVKYYHYRTRSILSNAYIDYKWASSANDANLLAQGYTATGVKRVKGE